MSATAQASVIHNPTLAQGLVGAMRAYSAAREALSATEQRYVQDYLASKGVQLGGRIIANRNETFVLARADARTFFARDAERVGVEYVGRRVKADGSVSGVETGLWVAYAPDGSVLLKCLTLAEER